MRSRLAEVARLAGASTDSPLYVTGDVVVDPRRVRPGDLFVALPGERSDGHDHVQDAAAAGAVAALVSRPVPADCALLVVPDPLAALQRLAAALFAEDQPLTVGLTGGSGTTSARELLGQVLPDLGPTLLCEGPPDDEVGLPLTLLRRGPDTRYAVLEYGARRAGRVAHLCGLARPDVAVVLDVGRSHLGEPGSVEDVGQAEGELVEAARRAAVLNADDPLVLAVQGRTELPVTTFGLGADADVRADGLELDGDGRAAFRLVTPAGSADVRLGLVGEHQAGLALAAAAALLAGGITDDVPRLARLLGAARPLSRMEVVDRPDGVTVVNDARDADPESMRAALKTLAVLSRGKTRRTWAVLGHMAGLGPDSREQHMDIGRFLVRLDPTALVVVGPEAGGIYAGAVLEGSWGGESVHVDDADEALALVAPQLRPGDVVLVKASPEAGLERVAEALAAAG